MPGFRPDTFCQSVVPNVVGLVARLPSPPAKVLPESGDEHDWVVPFAAKSQPLGLSAKLAAGMARPMASAAPTISIPHVRVARRIRRNRCPAAVRPGMLDVLTFPSLEIVLRDRTRGTRRPAELLSVAPRAGHPVAPPPLRPCLSRSRGRNVTSLLRQDEISGSGHGTKGPADWGLKSPSPSVTPADLAVYPVGERSQRY